MADEGDGGKGLGKKLGPLKVWQWVAAAGGTFLGVRWWRNRQAANAAASSTGTTAGLPGAFSTTTNGSSSTTPAAAPTTWQGWLQQALDNFQGSPSYSQAAFYNDALAWINGSCVTQTGYSALSNALATLGIPPGFGSALPALTVCSTSTTPPGGTTTPPGGTTTPPGGTTTPPASNPWGLSAAQLNIVDHFPAGMTGAAWSKLSLAEKINQIEHAPTNNITGAAWSKLTLAEKINEYAHQPAHA